MVGQCVLCILSYTFYGIIASYKNSGIFNRTLVSRHYHHGSYINSVDTTGPSGLLLCYEIHGTCVESQLRMLQFLMGNCRVLRLACQWIVGVVMVCAIFIWIMCGDMYSIQIIQGLQAIFNWYTYAVFAVLHSSLCTEPPQIKMLLKTLNDLLEYKDSDIVEWFRRQLGLRRP